jgi:hypothetical protein
MIRRIFLDLDDVCNTLAPFVLHSVGCDIGPSDYARYPREHGFNISEAANAMLGEFRYTPASFWASMPRSVGNMPSRLASTCLPVLIPC